jgi:hypothetical protein
LIAIPLKPNTQYAWQVRGHCFSGARSPWSEIDTFSTLPMHEGEEVLDPSLLKLTLWPNPVTDVLHIGIDGRDYPARIELFDAAGRMVQSGLFEPGSIDLDVSALPAGMYLLRVAGEAGQVTRLVVLE